MSHVHFLIVKRLNVVLTSNIKLKMVCLVYTGDSPGGLAAFFHKSICPEI